MKNFSMRIWNENEEIMSYSSDWMDMTWNDIKTAQDEGRLMIVSGLLANDATPLYEGDYVKVYNTFKEEEFKAEVVFKRGQFMLQTAELTNHSRWINYRMDLIGNKFNNAGLLLKDD
ncbi:MULTISPECIES: hypothetical protein [unclassified Fusibacter]|uniref:hypothetical protein n=1 Tax=unclassified Fusibacter TaxID=2624464 RepID=UPI001011E56F|nr:MULTISPECIES: hypothetical protein [unclassified Fusibacter]MCK8059416.1 hypothetical protein [Fusibacter sp. A2]NPE21120.1 hypothetical protein [Fusibacter sp. A1]RXV62390.1 hypothetical protein DWB64_04740 [Fusibacter sp. A1]